VWRVRRVFLDTTVLFSDPYLASASGRLLVRKVRDGDVQLLLSEVVIRESARHYGENVRESLEAKQSADAKLFELGHISELSHSPPSRDLLRSDYERNFRKLLQEIGATVIPLPDVPHDELLDRLFRERKPFKRKGEGYRDALIWSSLLSAIASDEDVDLVTNNVKDFLDPADHSLHPDLRDDLATTGYVGSLRTHLSLKHLIREITTRAESAVEEVGILLRGNPGARATLIDEIERLVTSHYPFGTELPLDEALAGPYETPTLSFIGDFGRLTVDDAREEPDGPVHVFLTAQGHLSIDVFVFKADFYSLDVDEEQFTLTDSDWNDHYVLGSLDRDVDVEVEAIWNAADQALRDVSVRDVDDAIAGSLDPHYPS
jgi:hypothetical protein